MHKEQHKGETIDIRLQNPHEMVLQHVEGRSCRLDHACRESVTNFLTERNLEEKAKIAVSTIKLLINPHGKPDLPDTLERLYCIEQMLRQPLDRGENEPFLEVQIKSRDHVIHALNTYLLGLLLFYCMMRTNRISKIEK